MASDDEMDTPETNMDMFVVNENVAMLPDQIFEGKMGKLPLLISVNVGYDSETPDPFMYHYESQEVLFPYKKDSQTRVMFRDSHHRTLSLPKMSPLTFVVKSDNRAMTVDQILTTHPLPVILTFARPECMDLVVDGHSVDHSFFGPLILYDVYEEPFMWCLDINHRGLAEEKPIVLPLNLKNVGFCPVVAIKGVTDPAGKLKDFIEKYSRDAKQLVYKEDPFFQELAFISRGPEAVTNINPYIDSDTFITINFKRRPPPAEPLTKAPSLPPRNPVQRLRSDISRRDEDMADSSLYSSLCDVSDKKHVYKKISPVDATRSKPTKIKVSQELTVNSKPPPDKNLTKYRPPPRTPPREPLAKAPTDTKTCEGQVYKRLMEPPELPARTKGHNVSELSISDVADKLKELGLHKYVKKFGKKHIDGVLLKKLTKESCAKEFGMSQVEFILLNTFVTEGHIPKTTGTAKSLPNN